MRSIQFLWIGIIAFGATAGVYKWVDEEGRVHYSDRPVEQAQTLNVPDAASSEHGGKRAEDTLSVENQTPDAGIEEATGYRQFELLEPEENQTFRSDEGAVSVALLLEPALDSEHEIRVRLDGNLIQGRFLSTQLQIRGVYRGTHSLQAVIVDRDGATVISSKSVNFHVRRSAPPSLTESASTIQPNSPLPAPESN